MKNIRMKGCRIALAASLMFAGGLVMGSSAQAQTASNVIQDGFTGTTAQLPWQAFNGACLTAGNGQAASNGGLIPSCASLASTYYSADTANSTALVGLGSTNADAAGSGALRLTNSFSENGAIIDTQPYASNLGIQVTFTTYTYGGNSGGTAKDGADGIGFYLLGAASTNGLANTLNDSSGNQLTAVPSIGSWGGSLGYSCSNTNSPYEGMAGAYMGLGMDEFGNFLNSPDNTGTGSQAGTSNGGDGNQYQPGRIGLRAYGNVNLAALQAYNKNATKSDVQATCKNGGTYSWSTKTTLYNLAYTYNSGKPFIPTAIATTTTVKTSAVTWASATKNNKSTGLSNCPTVSASTGTPSTVTTGGQQNGSSSTLSYTGGLYQLGAGVQKSRSDLGSDKTTTNSNFTKTNNGVTCVGSQNTETVVTATETDYPFTQTGATVTTPSSANASGYTGTGTMYGLGSDGNYYAITFKATSQQITNNFSQQFPDYAAIPGAFVNLDSSTPIALESAKKRTDAVPISYKLQITQAGLLSLWYSYNGGTYNPVLTGQDITQSNAPIPSSFLFGFGGSTGGSSNVHEITCFQVTPAETSASSAGLNIQSGEVRTGTQVYLAAYHTNNWWGQLTAQNLVVTGSAVSISPVANWDASCVLTGGACQSTNGSNTAQSASNRVIYSYQDTTVGGATSNTGIQLTWNNLTATQQGWLNDDTHGQDRLAYLMGDRSNEQPAKNATTSQIFRDRNSVLADIIDSGPTWVGPASAPYADSWSDKLHPDQTPAENSGALYSAFLASSATRLNVVYDGANDGFLHGFRTGSYDKNGNYIDNSTTPNDGLEVMAYMPQAVLKKIHNAQNTLDYANPKYSHAYYVDATPGTGDLFYNNSWHTWLVSGLGPGGRAIFALDITDPTQFTNANAASIVKGEWNGSTLSCTGTTNCGSNLGQTYGTPQIRRLHNGEWGIIFGNGFKSSTGDAGIFVMTIGSTGALDKVYYLSTGVGSAANPNGIAYVTPVDLDGDHITDVVYAGDNYGNVWRFDLSSETATDWAVFNYGNSSATPLFTTTTTTTTTVTPTSGAATVTPVTTTLSVSAQPGTLMGSSSVTDSGTGTVTATTITNQPIATQLMVLSVAPSATGQPRVMIEFGTGSVIPQTTTADIQYSSGQQGLYGIWDWDYGQSGTAGAGYASLPASSQPTSGISIGQLQAQTVTGTFSAAQSGIGQGARTLSNNSICFVGNTCASIDAQGKLSTSPGTQFGWYLSLPGANGVSGVGGKNQTEQVIYSPIETDGSFIVNTTVPANNSPLTCTVQSAQGWTMAINPANGGAFQNSFFSDASGNFVNISGAPVSGIALNATGSPSVVTANKLPYLVSQTVNGAGAVNQINPPGSMYNKRLTWLQVH
ncbi:PilC/PilY family type IV pilus protein [Dyella kyungheensis]|uniref:Pilus assembly protein PilY n=1 Tax=Dyella kyungheensis TaxID=1242174 RepID=A0ABS2JQJ8_9GAMM|nr:PilC/PilY family type IV pilus protein [Dyella kyungheensis]MBM7120702.1 pilus assembly protein PilY [Dyella kyungheensis]